jgi:hypothetical protein
MASTRTVERGANETPRGGGLRSGARLGSGGGRGVVGESAGGCRTIVEEGGGAGTIPGTPGGGFPLPFPCAGGGSPPSKAGGSEGGPRDHPQPLWKKTAAMTMSVIPTTMAEAAISVQDEE